VHRRRALGGGVCARARQQRRDASADILPEEDEDGAIQPNQPLRDERLQDADAGGGGLQDGGDARAGAALACRDRLFSAGGSALRYKPGAAVVSARRGGTTAALDALNKYFTINCMPVVSSKYWNMVHGNTPDEVRHDLEGMQVMRTLGRNMAWLLKCIEIGRAAGITTPEPEPPVRTNFIR